MVYIIAYDINTTVKDYSSLYERIKSLGDSYQHPMESVWFVSSETLDVKSIREQIMKELDKKDHVFVASLDSSIEGWLPDTFWDWLIKELGVRQ